VHALYSKLHKTMGGATIGTNPLHFWKVEVQGVQTAAKGIQIKVFLSF